MGVPGFYRWAVRKVPRLRKSTRNASGSPQEFDNVYLDFNGVVHGCIEGNPGEDEEAIFARIEAQILFLLTVVQPMVLLFIALDGVAPRAKMNQQRSRRFRSARDAELLAASGNVLDGGAEAEAAAGTGFDRNAITPGTEFMQRLTARLYAWAEASVTSVPALHGVTVIISGDRDPGEGEHKIMEVIRHNPDSSHCMFSNDADLVFLGLVSTADHVDLLREKLQARDSSGDKVQVEDDQRSFELLSITAVRDWLAGQYPGYDRVRLATDFAGICCLAGNDFLPHAESVDIYGGGLDKLLAAYGEVLAVHGHVVNEDLSLVPDAWRALMLRMTEAEVEALLETRGLGLGQPAKPYFGPGPPRPPPVNGESAGTADHVGCWDGLSVLVTGVPNRCKAKNVVEAFTRQNCVAESAQKVRPIRGGSSWRGPLPWLVRFADPKSAVMTLVSTRRLGGQKLNTKWVDPRSCQLIGAPGASDPTATSSSAAQQSPGEEVEAETEADGEDGVEEESSPAEEDSPGAHASNGVGASSSSSALTTGKHATDSSPESSTPVGEWAPVEWQAALDEAIRDSLEYWFGKENLSRDSFLRRHCWLREDRYVPLKVLATFNRMRSWCQDIGRLAAIARTSSKLEVLGEGDDAMVRGVDDFSARPGQDPNEESERRLHDVMRCVCRQEYPAASRLLRKEYYSCHAGPTTAESPPLPSEESADDSLVALERFRSRSFLHGVEWVLRYYLQGCSSWSWFYPAHYPPLCVGLADCVEDRAEPVPRGEPFPPELQLLSVLPPQSAALLPEQLRPLLVDAASPLADLYPRQFEVDIKEGDKEWQGVALLPFIDEARLRKVLQESGWDKKTPLESPRAFAAVLSDDTSGAATKTWTFQYTEKFAAVVKRPVVKGTHVDVGEAAAGAATSQEGKRARRRGRRSEKQDGYGTHVDVGEAAAGAATSQEGKGARRRGRRSEKQDGYGTGAQGPATDAGAAASDE